MLPSNDPADLLTGIQPLMPGFGVNINFDADVAKRLYVDGVLVETNGTVGAAIDAALNSSPIAFNATNDLSKASALFDDVALWNRAITSDEIDYLHNSGSGNIVSDVNLAPAVLESVEHSGRKKAQNSQEKSELQASTHPWAALVTFALAILRRGAYPRTALKSRKGGMGVTISPIVRRKRLPKPTCEGRLMAEASKVPTRLEAYISQTEGLIRVN